jgi:hypothetical protein
VSGATEPQGFFKFKIIGCTPGFTARVSITWPNSLTGTYSKYGKATAGAVSNSFYTPQSLSISGNTASFNITDGQQGDDDWSVNGEITDPSGPIAIAAPADALPVPTVNHLILIMALIALVLVLVRMNRKSLYRQY